MKCSMLVMPKTSFCYPSENQIIGMFMLQRAIMPMMLGGTPVSGSQCLLSSQVVLEFELNKNGDLKIVLISLRSHLERHTP